MADQRASRPRIEGERGRQILLAALEVLGELGYDRLTFDEVAGRAKASKASLYRRWSTKDALISDAIGCGEDGDDEAPPVLPDTGSLRGDLLALADSDGFFDVGRASLVSALATAIHRDPQTHAAVRRKLVADGTKHLRPLLHRARERGQTRPGLDIDLLSAALPGLVLFRMTFETPGEFPPGFIRSIVEQIILPAAQPDTTERGES
ncbi:TetR/AcrR family transcriptional regulator [Catenuloplanes japonicus]|uniref:TetR/AcrR family transcriptional regulator n=1 Tax=Catenuloplanes japonicus TaxID=33876 RepID=UPI00052754E5|nr:TetR/AcrR family transcriptional regulator [Catenuloplanes japonicus]